MPELESGTEPKPERVADAHPADTQLKFDVPPETMVEGEAVNPAVIEH